MSLGLSPRDNLPGNIVDEPLFVNAKQQIIRRINRDVGIWSIHTQIWEETQKLVSLYKEIGPSSGFESPLQKIPTSWHAANTVVHNDLAVLDPRNILRSVDPQDQKLGVFMKHCEKHINQWEQFERSRAKDIHEACYTLGFLKALHRMLSPKFASFDQPPVPEGPNGLRTCELWAEWTYRKYLVRALHLPGLIIDAKTEGHFDMTKIKYRVSLAQVYELGRCLLEREIYMQPEQEQDWSTEQIQIQRRRVDAIMPGFEWLRNSRAILQQIFRQISQKAFTTPEGTQPVQLGDLEHLEQFLEYNLAHNSMSVLDTCARTYRTGLEQHPFERLLINLLNEEWAFEQYLAIEHIEDKLFNKQVIAIDETISAARVQNTPFYGLYFRTAVFSPHFLNTTNYIQQILGKMALVDRQRRNFRLFRDWIGRRPWRTILLYLDTDSPQHTWRKEAMRSFNSKGLGGDGHDAPGDYENGRGYRYALENYPCGVDNISFHLFGVHPADHGEFLRGKDQGTPNGRCPICRQQYAVNDLVFVLHCNHRAHVRCAFRKWDMPGTYLHECPEPGCATPVQKLNWQEAGVEPELYNIFGWEPYRTNNSGPDDLRPPRPGFDTQITSIYNVPAREPDSRHHRLAKQARAFVRANKGRNEPEAVSSLVMKVRRTRLDAQQRRRVARQFGSAYPFAPPPPRRIPSSEVT
ncbi:hypothetical protein PVAG01_05947 [Phlyctema vagabunda]|uniref:RING-type domain-containing protein n=1 Tax=Phlyctema vagabunda TaxID=108571 RepID=A0ABR4PFL5_9HELO